MASTLLKALRQSGVYALANLAAKGAGLILLVFYLDPAYLSQADYGRLMLFETGAALLITLGGLGLAPGFLKAAADTSDRRTRRTLVTTTVAGAAAAGAGAALGVVLAAPAIAPFFTDAPTEPLPITALRWMGLYAGLKILGAAPLSVLRYHERVGVYAAATVGELVVFVGGAVWALVSLKAGLVGVTAAYALSAAVADVLLIGGTVIGGGFRVSRRQAAVIMRVGMPLAFSGLAGTVLKSGDQYVLKAFASASEVAVYGLATKFAGMVNMLFVQSFNMAFAVLGLKAAVSSGAALHRRVLRPYVVVTGWGVLGASVLALDVTELASPNPAFLAAEPLILPIAAGFWAYGLYYLMMNVLYAHAHTRSVARLVISAAVLNAVLNLLAIPWIGAVGAALTTFLSYAALAALTAREAVRLDPRHYPWRVIPLAACLVLGLWGAAQLTREFDPALRFTVRLALVAAYPPLVLMTGIYRWREAREFVRMLQGRLRGSTSPDHDAPSPPAD